MSGSRTILRRLVAIALGGTALLACSESSPRATDSVVASSPAIERDTAAASQTDSLAYRIVRRADGQYEARAEVIFRNRMADTAYFVNCNGATGVRLERLVSDTWVPSWSSEQDGCLSGPIVVAPGDSLRRSVLLFDGYHPISSDAPAEAASTYRLVWTTVVHHYEPRAPLANEVPEAQRVSNRFFLVGAPR